MKIDSEPFRNPLVLALDVDTTSQAEYVLSQVGDLVGGVKLGPRLCLKYGMGLVQKIAKKTPVFLDNKHFDIPSTMETAVRASFEAGASAVTVHAFAGSNALKKMAELESFLNQQRPFRIFAVTILTSWAEGSLPGSMKNEKIAQHVRRLAEEVQQSGLRSLVCSAHELKLIADLNLYALTPGIRMAESAVDDQQRVATPREACLAGARALVVGRPLLQAQDPGQLAQQILESLKV